MFFHYFHKMIPSHLIWTVHSASRHPFKSAIKFHDAFCNIYGNINIIYDINDNPESNGNDCFIVNDQ